MREAFSASRYGVQVDRVRTGPLACGERTHLKAGSDLALSVDGPHLAAQAIRAGLVDEYQLFVGPAIVGGGNPFFPNDVRVDLELLDQRRFGNGVVYLRYGVKDHGQPQRG